MTREITAYFTNSQSNSISIVDGQKEVVAKTIHLDFIPTEIAASTRSNALYIIGSVSQPSGTDFLLAELDLANEAILNTVSLDIIPDDVAVDSESGTVYVTGFNCKQILLQNMNFSGCIQTRLQARFHLMKNLKLKSNLIGTSVSGQKKK